MKLHLSCRIPQRDIVVDLDVADGETVALMGPNGAGKSSIVEFAVGLIEAEGDVTLNGSAVSDLPTHRRGIGLLTQDALLLPHLTVEANVAFGPLNHGASRTQARQTARTWLERLELNDLASRRPHQLSGGQAQRVALARALAAEPQVVLLDEPMAALDVTAIPTVRSLLRELLADRTAVIVTHDVLDALTLADRTIVIEHGRIVESGPTKDVLTSPRSQFAADIAGLNLIAGTFTDGRLRGTVDVVGSSLIPLSDGAPVVAVFSPSAVAVYREQPSGSPRNVWHTTVTALDPLADRIRVRTPIAAADVTPSAVAELGLAPGQPIVLSVKATEVTLDVV